MEDFMVKLNKNQIGNLNYKHKNKEYINFVFNHTIQTKKLLPLILKVFCIQ
jgi:hypothetical protein